MTDKDAFRDILKSLNWNLLCLQKQQLISKVSGEPNSVLWGLVYLLNALQEAAQEAGLLNLDDPALLQLCEVFQEKPADITKSLDIDALIVTVKQGASTHEHDLTLEDAQAIYDVYVEENPESGIDFRKFIEPCKAASEDHLLGCWKGWSENLDEDEPYDVSLAWKSGGYVMRQFHKK